MEVPAGGENNDRNNDMRILRISTEQVWDQYNGVKGAYFYMPGHTDWGKAPFIFLPAAGVRQGESVFDTGEFGQYWTATAFSDEEYYRFYFNEKRFTTDGRLAYKRPTHLVLVVNGIRRHDGVQVVCS